MREPDRDWLAVAHYGGPARGFSSLMPPWTGMLTSDELKLAVSHAERSAAMIAGGAAS